MGEGFDPLLPIYMQRLDEVNTINSRFSGHLWDIFLCPEWRESVIPGVIFSQTSIDGDLDFVHNSKCL